MNSMQTMMEQLLKTPGWGSLEDLQSKAAGDQAKLMDEARAEAALVHAALSTDEGQRFLAWLLQKTLLRPPAEQEMAAISVEAYAIAKARREGQNGIAFMILHALDVARDAARIS
jgi:hypothetical protein